MRSLVPITPRERWVHYSSRPDQIVFYDTDYSKAKGEHGHFKPIGLWITPYGQEDNWFEWSMGEEFRISKLNYVHDVELAACANILRITSVEGLDAFSQEYAIDLFSNNQKAISPTTGERLESWMYCDWPRLAKIYDGIMISPYQWSRRHMTHNGSKTDWYYSWDCASGCIWNARAIEGINLRSTVSAGYVEKPRRSITEMMSELKSAVDEIADVTNPSQVRTAP